MRNPKYKNIRNSRFSTSDFSLKYSGINSFTGSDSITAQKNIAKDLIDNFPNIEFLIIDQDGAVGVEWDDGATCQEVCKIIDKYNLLGYQPGSDAIVRKTDTSFNDNNGGCVLVLIRNVTDFTEKGHKIKYFQIMEAVNNNNNLIIINQ